MIYRFTVDVELPDDDQSDPDDLALCIEKVLNCEGGSCADWQEAHKDTLPESRPKCKVNITV